MKYAAKRTWPDRPKMWEQQGEAENLEAFALAFASELGLGVGTEFEVLDKDADDAALLSFRITNTQPYTLGPVTAHQEDQAVTDAPPPPPFGGAALSFFGYITKVWVIAIVVMGGLFWFLKYMNLTNQ